LAQIATLTLNSRYPGDFFDTLELVSQRLGYGGVFEFEMVEYSCLLISTSVTDQGVLSNDLKIAI
jgi:hypothetical protein